MAVTVETLDKLERKMTLSLPLSLIRTEVDTRLKRLAQTVRMDGFRPGKVPMHVLARRYGGSVQYEVINDKVGEAFAAAASEAQLRIAGQPQITEKDHAAEGQMSFDAVFEVLPEVRIADLADVEVEKISAEVSEAAIDKTLEILRKQRRSFTPRAADAAAQEGDRVTVDFEGKIDGEPFAGGKAQDFEFLIGEGQMLGEFEDAVRGMKPGESKTFPLAFPAHYHGKEVAGKTADFLVTLKKTEAVQMPEIGEALAHSLGKADGSVAGLRADVQKNLEREVKARLLARNKQAAMDALLSRAELDLPKASVQVEIDRMIEAARAELKQRGIKDADKAPLPQDMFRPQAERSVRLRLVVGEVLRANGLQARPDQVKAQVDELAASYEKPEEMVSWYFSDRQRLAAVEARVVEGNVTDFVFARARVREKILSFDELMASQG